MQMKIIISTINSKLQNTNNPTWQNDCKYIFINGIYLDPIVDIEGR